MRATLPERAANPYYGQWPRAFPAESRAKARSIARHGLAASTESAALDVQARDFPGIRTPAHRKFNLRAEEKVCAPPAL
jgi:hypothetical protein